MKGQHPKRVSELLGQSGITVTPDCCSRVVPGLGGNGVMEEAPS